MNDERVLTVRELAEEAELGLVLLTGERSEPRANLLDQRVLSIHHSDLDDPRPYLGFGGVLMTHGKQLARNARTAHKYLDRIAERQTVALVVGVGEYLDRVDPVLVDYAQGKGMVVFEVPETVAFRAIFAYVHDALASVEMHRLRRLVSLHEQLVRLLIEQGSMGELTKRIAMLLDMAIVLFDKSGQVLASDGSLSRVGVSEEVVWALYRAHARGLAPIGAARLGTASVSLYPVEVHGSVERVLAAMPLRQAVSEFDEMALSFTRQMVALDVVRCQENAVRRRRIRAGLLRSLVLGERPPEELAARLAEEGIDLDQMWRMVAFISDPPEALAVASAGAEVAEGARGLMRLVEESFEHHGVPCAALFHGDAVIALAVFREPGSESSHLVISDARRSLDEVCGSADVAAGASGPGVGGGSAVRRLRQALESARLARSVDSAGDGVSLFDEINARHGLLAGQNREMLLVLSERVVRPLVDYDRSHSTRLLETAGALLDHGLSPSDTAAALYIHRNTLGKRLRRIEELTKLDLASMDDVMELYFALRAGELTGSDTP